MFFFFHRSRRGTIRHIWDSAATEIDLSGSPDHEMANSYRCGSHRHPGERPPHFPLAIIVYQGRYRLTGPDEVVDRLPNRYKRRFGG